MSSARTAGCTSFCAPHRWSSFASRWKDRARSLLTGVILQHSEIEATVHLCAIVIHMVCASSKKELCPERQSTEASPSEHLTPTAEKRSCICSCIDEFTAFRCLWKPRRQLPRGLRSNTGYRRGVITFAVIWSWCVDVVNKPASAQAGPTDNALIKFNVQSTTITSPNECPLAETHSLIRSSCNHGTHYSCLFKPALRS